MVTLAINTSGSSVAVSLLEGMNVLDQLHSRDDFRPDHQLASVGAGSDDRLPPGYTRKRSKRGQATQRVFPPGASVMLAPLIQKILQRQNLTPTKLSLICVAIGPGMFTGLRVGVVTAKALAYATGAKIVAVNTLDAIAAQNFAHCTELQSKNLFVAVNAQRRQLFVNQFQHIGPWQVQKSKADRIVDRRQFLADLPDAAVATGPGLAQISSPAEVPKTGAQIVSDDHWELSAVSVGRFGTQVASRGQFDNLWSLEPLYFRPSAAEEQKRRLSD